MRNIVLFERLTDTIAPLSLIAGFLTTNGYGFATLVPVIACVIFSFVQPFVRIFVFDKARGPLIRSGQTALLLSSSALLYLALSAGICRLVMHYYGG